MSGLGLIDEYDAGTLVDKLPEMSLRKMLRLALRTWPYMRPMLKHLILLLFLGFWGYVITFGSAFIGTDLWAALETAGCRAFIESFPDGLDTALGRSGDTMSVGQQQRLSIARGLVRETKILILDEPTAALDPHTENQLVASLHAAAENRLVIVIAHRLSTIRHADRIVFLEDGEVRDVGSHDELMANPESAYREFVELQAG